MGLHAYKVTRDYGFAPNPFEDVCTLATCKPGIRRKAVKGDLIAACGSAELGLVGRILCIVRVHGSMPFQSYWDDARFAAKKPRFGICTAKCYGDNIYHRDDDGGWIQERSHHSFKDGAPNPLNLDRDTSADAVLWGEDFIYFGANAPAIPAELRNFQGQDLYPAKVRDHRSDFTPAMVAAVDDWFRSLTPRGRQGRPASWD